jgi:murein DD-endopeptidase MepM/ murein hydrolase activator NlpD
VFKLNADGRTVLYSTYLGGGNEDEGYGIAVDGAGNAHVTGFTSSSDFPTVNAPYPKYGGGYWDAFMFKLGADGRTVRYSTSLGGGDAFLAKFSDTGTLHSPLDNQSSSLMKGRVRGECLVGGYCARGTDTSAHNGIDYAVLAGTPVYAICDGVVKIARTKTTTPNIWNRFTVINHSKGCGYPSLWAYYGHIEATVSVGQRVTTGQKIGVIADWGSNSHLHLSLNSAYKSNGWGYVNVGEITSKDCNKTSVVRRRDLLTNQGWIDPAILGINAGWNPFLLQGGTSAGNCNAPTQRYIPAPMGKSLPYYPWKTP